jgi:Zn-dependent alcohol dehydrogenase
MIESKAAVLTTHGGGWQIADLVTDDPREGEVLVKLAFAGLCYSDEHLRFDTGARLPIVGGHEGAGVVTEVGPGVTDLAGGDPVALTFVATCGRCHWCASGRSNLCTSRGRRTWARGQQSGSFRLHGRTSRPSPRASAAFCGLGTFSQYAVVSRNSCVPVDKSVPLSAVALVSCGVLTGWGAAVRTAGTRVGDQQFVATIDVAASVRYVDCCDIVCTVPPRGGWYADTGPKRYIDRAGIVHNAISDAEATADRPGRGAVIVTANGLTAELVSQAFKATGRGGTRDRRHVARRSEVNVQMQAPCWPPRARVVGSFFGSTNPAAEIGLLFGLYQRGQLALEELISGRYWLAEITTGYADLASGRNARGVIEFG